MPHFIIECTPDVANKIGVSKLNYEVFNTVKASNLFALENIKCRIKTYEESLVAGKKQDFIHIWGYIKKGRTVHQKRALSESIVEVLTSISDNIFVVSCNIQELDSDSYVKIQKEIL